MKTKRTTIAAVSHNCSTGDSDKNLALMEEVLAGGETSETDIYVFPELNISGGVIFKPILSISEKKFPTNPTWRKSAPWQRDTEQPFALD